MRGTGLRIGRSNALLTGLITAASVITLGSAQYASAATTAPVARAHPATPSGSIVYLKRGYVWIAHADGTAARQFTRHTFGWSSPSEANNGTVVVAGGVPHNNPGGTDTSGGSEIYRFRPDGTQIGTFTPTWGTYSSPSCPTDRPRSVEVSPDGTKVAYGILECATSIYTTLWTPANATGLNFPHQSIGQSFYYEPHWVSNGTFVVSHAGLPVSDTQARWYTHGVSQADNTGYKGWGWPAMTGTGAQGIIDRQGDKLVVLEDDAAAWSDGKPRHVRLWLWTGHNIPTNWAKRCTVTLPAAQFSRPLQAHPSFSPNGQEIIWGDNRGIEEASLANPASCASIQPHLLIPGGSQPFFSAGAEQRGAANPRQPG